MSETTRTGTSEADTAPGHEATEAAPGWVPPARQEPLWMYVAAGVGAFFHLMQVTFFVSPHNRARLLEPELAAMRLEGVDPEVIASIADTAAKLSPLKLNLLALLSGLSVLALIGLIARRRVGLFAYTIVTLCTVLFMAVSGLFSAWVLIVPTMVTVIATRNREFLT